MTETQVRRAVDLACAGLLEETLRELDETARPGDLDEWDLEMERLAWEVVEAVRNGDERDRDRALTNVDRHIARKRVAR